MFRIAGEMLEDEGASFIITGEVLGQRPMSQNRHALTLIDSESGYKGLILRPLSAKHIQLTIPEEKGWIDRKALLNLSGRSRKPQMELAKKLNIREYPSPAGGCLLTDKIFSQRLEDLLRSKTNPDIREIDLLRSGRHFRIGDETKVIVGRNKSENLVIKSLSKKDDLLLRTTSVPGPTTLVVGKILSDTAELAAIMTVSYSDAEDGVLTEVNVISNNRENTLKVTGRAKKEFQHYMVC
jgi:tRNA U34 2-thiouridine synthase MnmA/TrmU